MSLADIDECELGINNCHENSTCVDVVGSFVCICNNGFDGDGVNCTSKRFLHILAKGGNVSLNVFFIRELWTQ